MIIKKLMIWMRKGESDKNLILNPRRKTEGVRVVDSKFKLFIDLNLIEGCMICISYRQARISVSDIGINQLLNHLLHRFLLKIS